MTNDKSPDFPDKAGTSHSDDVDHAAPVNVTAAHSHSATAAEAAERTGRTEKVLRETLSGKATTYFADGRTPPPAAFPELDQPDPAAPAWGAGSTGAHASFWRSKRTYFALAAGVATVALAGSLVAHHLSDKDNTPHVATQAEEKTPTPSATSGSASTDPSEAKSDPTNTDASLPPHMKPTHDGPVKLVNFPFACPASMNKLVKDGTNYITNKPVDPIQYCSAKGEMDNTPADSIRVLQWYHLVVVDTPPATPSNGSQKLSPMRPRVIPDGFTYTGSDYEVSFIHSHIKSNTQGVCPAFEDFAATYRKSLSKLVGEKWVVVDKDPHPLPSDKLWCHQARIDLAKRTVYLDAAVKDVGTARPQGERRPNSEGVRRVMDSVNSQCLSLKAAGRAVKTSAQAELSGKLGTNIIRRSIPAGGECARAYFYPFGGLQFIIFGK